MRTGAITVALLACSCATAGYPRERGERLEQRVDNLETPGAGQVNAEAAASKKRVEQLDARIAALEKRLDAVAATGEQDSGGASGAADASRLADEVARQRAALDEQTRRVAGLEAELARLGQSEQPGRRKAAARTPARTTPSPSTQPPARPAPPAPAPLAATDVPRDKASYLAFAREQESKGQKAVARDLYEQFVASYPDDPASAEAHYRLGELAFADKRYRDAIGEYGKVAQDFPRSGHAPDALVRTADSMMQMGMKDEAATVLAQVPKRYPSSAAAVRANKRLAELGGARAAP